MPKKPPNKGGEYPRAEVAEGSRPTKGNTGQKATPRTQSRESVLPGLQRVRKIAREEKDARFTALLHHVITAALKESFFALKRQAASGVDGVM
ncbi:MAG: hypothetical protein JRJ03_11410 [Deltaproteobacteria bacterium]|nr:hypothetical protein [Deltaproteobacteria bacterium]